MPSVVIEDPQGEVLSMRLATVEAGLVVVLFDDRDSVEAVLGLARCAAAAMP
jgi:hypothetical protein